MAATQPFSYEAAYRDSVIEVSEAVGILRGYILGYKDDEETVEVPLKEVRRVMQAVANVLRPNMPALDHEYPMGGSLIMWVDPNA